MNDPHAEAEIRRHFKGATLEKKLAELKSMPDAAQMEAIQMPLRVALAQTIKDYFDTQKKQGVYVSPRDVTMALMEVLCSHTCRTREKSLSVTVIIHQMCLGLASCMMRWYVTYTQSEAKTQPGG